MEILINSIFHGDGPTHQGDTHCVPATPKLQHKVYRKSRAATLSAASVENASQTPAKDCLQGSPSSCELSAFSRGVRLITTFDGRLVRGWIRPDWHQRFLMQEQQGYPARSSERDRQGRKCAVLNLHLPCTPGEPLRKVQTKPA